MTLPAAQPAKQAGAAPDGPAPDGPASDGPAPDGSASDGARPGVAGAGHGRGTEGGYRSFGALSRPYRPRFSSPGTGIGRAPAGMIGAGTMGAGMMGAGMGVPGEGTPGPRSRGGTLLALALGAAVGLLLAAAVLSLDFGTASSPLLLTVAVAALFGPVLTALLALRLARAPAPPAERQLGAAGSAEAAAEAANAAPEGLAVTDRDGHVLFASRLMRRLAPGIMSNDVRLPEFLVAPPEAVEPSQGSDETAAEGPRRIVLVDGRAAVLSCSPLPHPEGRRLWRLELEAEAPAPAVLFDLLAALEGETGLALRLALADPAPAPAAAPDGTGPVLWRQLPTDEPGPGHVGSEARAVGLALLPEAPRLWLVAEEVGAAVPAPAELPPGLAATAVGAALLDGRGEVAAANAAFAEMTGWADGGAGLAELVAEAEREALGHALTAAGAAAGGAPATLRFNRHQERSVHLYLSPCGDTAPAAHRLALLVDVTQQKGVEQQFAHGQKMQAIGQLAGGVAHDFNNLLTAMIGFCDLLLQRHPPTDQSFADVQQIKQNALRAAGLVRQLLAFSRRQTLRPRPLDVTDVLADLRHLLSRLIGERIRLKIVHGRDLGIVRVDRGQLEQVIINLAVNARDAMRDGGSLTIATAAEEVAVPLDQGNDRIPPGRYVRIDVADTGTGVPAEHADNIFDPFFTTKKPGEGTGLGLSTVYGIIRQTGGFVFLDRNGPYGATFSILLPEAAPEARRAEGEPAVPEVAAQRDLTGRETLLLVEDEDAVRLFAARSLRNKGYTVMEASSGEAALELSRAFASPIHALVTDVVMPNMDGPTLAQEILRDRPGLSVVFMSGYAEDAVRQALSGGDMAASFLQKPFTLNDLAVTVKAALAGAESSGWPSRG